MEHGTFRQKYDLRYNTALLEVEISKVSVDIYDDALSTALRWVSIRLYSIRAIRLYVDSVPYHIQ